MGDTERERFAALYERCSRRVFAYARRRCDTTTAQDVVSDAFLVAVAPTRRPTGRSSLRAALVGVLARLHRVSVHTDLDARNRLAAGLRRTTPRRRRGTRAHPRSCPP